MGIDRLKINGKLIVFEVIIWLIYFAEKTWHIFQLAVSR